MHPSKIVLVSTNGYLAGRDHALLQELLDSKIELFCVVGVAAEQWEEALDWLCIGANGNSKYSIVTTAHTSETVAEVISFAEAFNTSTSTQVEVLYV